MTCPICGKDRAITSTVPCTNHPLWEDHLPQEMHWRICISCGHWHEPNFPRREIRGDLGHEFPSAQTLLDQIPKWSLALSMTGAQRGAVLDFGCGSGAAGFAAEAMGCTPYWVDARESVCSALRDLGVNEDEVGAEIADGWPAFDLIILGDVIEHIEEPQGVLGMLVSRLAPDGMILLSTPDASHPAWDALGTGNPYGWEIEHAHAFTRTSMLLLADKAGLEVVFRYPNARYLMGMDWILKRREQ